MVSGLCLKMYREMKISDEYEQKFFDIVLVSMAFISMFLGIAAIILTIPWLRNMCLSMKQNSKRDINRRLLQEWADQQKYHVKWMETSDIRKLLEEFHDEFQLLATESEEAFRLSKLMTKDVAKKFLDTEVSIASIAHTKSITDNAVVESRRRRYFKSMRRIRTKLNASINTFRNRKNSVKIHPELGHNKEHKLTINNVANTKIIAYQRRKQYIQMKKTMLLPVNVHQMKIKGGIRTASGTKLFAARMRKRHIEKRKRQLLPVSGKSNKKDNILFHGSSKHINKVKNIARKHSEVGQIKRKNKEDSKHLIRKKEEVAKNHLQKKKSLEQRIQRRKSENKRKVKRVTPTNFQLIPGIDIGDRCELPGDRKATIMFVGEVKEIGAGYWIGVQFDEAVGKNDGSIKGTRYFTCEDKFGGFCKPGSVKIL